MGTFEIIAAASSNPAGGAAMKEVVGASAAATIVTVALLWLGLAPPPGPTPLLEKVARWSAHIGHLPKWVAFPSGLASGSLIVALVGMYWDISLHIDQGRDPGPLANPAHYLILFGLYGIFAAGWLSIVLTKGEERIPTGIAITRDWWAPMGAVLMCACGAFSLVGFPLDDVWHRLFGQDVTLWGPTHLMLIGGAALTLVGQAVLLVEGTRAGGEITDAEDETTLPAEVRLRRAALAGAFLIGLSTFQAEFDFGVPQFNFLFQPMLIVLAAALALTSARLWGGRGTALAAVAFFLLMRGIVSLLVGGVWGEVTPHMPLYIAEGLLVEAVAFTVGTRRPLLFGAVAGGLVGTVGMAAEWGWSHVWMPLPWPSSLLPDAIVASLLMGLAGGVLGAFVGSTLRVRPQALPRGLKPAAVGAMLVVVALIGFGLATSPDKGVKGTVALRDVPSTGGRSVQATVTLDPPSAAKDARWLTVTDWQAGKLIVNRLQKVREGVYRTTQPIPVYGDWKALVRLHVGNSLTPIPISLPDDPAIPAKGVPATSQFTRTFIADKKILQRESKGAGAGLWALAYGVVLAIVISLLALLTWALLRLSRAETGGPPRGGARFAREEKKPERQPAVLRPGAAS